MKRIVVTTIAAAAAAVALSACTATEGRYEAKDGVTSSSGPASADGKSADEDEKKPTFGRFGQEAYTYEDGIKVSVGAPVWGKIANQFDENNGASVAGVKITIKNDTAEPFEPALATVGLTYGTDGETAEKLCCVTNLSGEEINRPIAPGRSATGLYQFRVPKSEASSILVSVEPSFSHGPAFFEN